MNVEADMRGADEPATVIIFACLKGLPPEASPCQLPWRAVDLLRSWGARLILVSASSADCVRQVQRELQVVEAFVCEGGGAVHVPGRYRCSQDTQRSEAEWEILRFNPPDKAAAVKMVRDVFLGLGWQDVLTIGVGCDLDDYGVLSTVEVPVVVRDLVKDQSGLLRYVPGAYLTNATGPAGWAEALIGP
jgi:predicted mannosyl-3-phosphoglycerate phosphatase (HAD superfamily)